MAYSLNKYYGLDLRIIIGKWYFRGICCLDRTMRVLKKYTIFTNNKRNYDMELSFTNNERRKGMELLRN